MAVAIVLGALAGAAGFAPLFAGLRMTRRVTDTSNLGHAGALLLGVLLSVAVLFVTAIACALLAREFVLPFVLAEVVALSVAAIGFGLYQFISLQQARAQEALHEQQLQLMREKTASLQEKMDKMDALDQELRQMVKGAGTGSSPKGDGGTAGRRRKGRIFPLPTTTTCCWPPPVWKRKRRPHYQLHYAENRTERYGGAAGPADAAGISAIRIVDDAVYLAGVRHDYV